MADPLADYAENLIARWIAKGEVCAAGNRYVTPYSTDPTDADTGTEIAAGAIARIQQVAGNWAVPSAVDGGYQFSTSADTVWATVTVAQSDFTHWGIRDANAAGNLLWYAQLNEPITLPIGKRPAILAGNLKGIVGNADCAFSDYTENAIATWISKGTAMAAGNRWITLFSADPTDAGSGAEISGDAFVRVAMAAADWSDTVDFNGGKRTTNVNPFAFTAPTADKPNATHWGIFDAAAGGNLLYYGALANEVALPTGRVLNFPAGLAKVTVGA